MKLIRNLVIASSLLLCGQAIAQTLIYARSYAETPASLGRRFPNGAVRATIDEKLAMVRGYEKTEIYSVSMIDGKRSLLFSDEGMHLEIVPAGASLGGAKVYAKGVMWEWRSTPNPGVYSTPAIYEVRLDGSNGLRKLAEIQPDQAPGIVNTQAKKAVREASADNGYMVSVYDVSTWKPLHTWDFSRVSKAHCPGCIPMSYGWLADGTRLFFNLEAVDDDDDESANVNAPGTYLTSEDGQDLGGIPKHAGQFQLPGYVRRLDNVPYLIGQLPNGDYMFCDHGSKAGPLPKSQRSSETFLVLTGPDFRFKKQILLRNLAIRSFYLSPSGKYLAYVEDRPIANYRTETHVWGKDLGTGEEKEWFIVPPPNPPGSPEPTVVLTVLGWVDN